MGSFYVAAHALVMNGNVALALHRSATNDYLPGRWDLPGGSVEMGETVEEALRREGREECGLELRPRRIIFAYANRDQVPLRQTIQLVYECEAAGEVRLNPAEHDAYRWIPLAELAGLDTIPYLTELMRHKTW